MEIEIARAWDRLPNETDKAWEAFQRYRELPLMGPKEKRRNFENVSALIGHNSIGTCQLWSAKYNWVERARAYDANNSLKAEDFRAVARYEGTKAYYAEQTFRLQALGEVIEKKLQTLANSDDPNSRDLQRTADSLRTLDMLWRRMLKLPTAFKPELGDDPVGEEEEVLVFGAKSTE